MLVQISDAISHNADTIWSRVLSNQEIDADVWTNAQQFIIFLQWPSAAENAQWESSDWAIGWCSKKLLYVEHDQHVAAACYDLV